jgi:3-dehydroquinate dehydratase / shikimate dehydrogenase
MIRASIVAELSILPSRDGGEMRALAHTADWLEVRADLLGDLDVRWVRGLFPGKLLYSLRSRAAAGAFTGRQSERVERLIGASHRYDLIELEAATDLRPEILAEVPPNKRVISWYGHARDEAELIRQFEHISSTQSGFYKMVVEAKRVEDTLTPLLLLRSLARPDIVAFASGKNGFWSRLLAPHFGARLIFGSAGQGWTAEGDPSVFKLVEDYGLPYLSPVDEIYGIVGNPVNHSLSPRIHNAAYRALRHRALFMPFQVGSFGDFWREVVTSGKLALLGLTIKGLTVSSPYKEAALREAGAISPMSRQIGATNVFVRDNGHWKADTTDPEGVILALRNRGIPLVGKTAAVIGCGGAGRAVAAALSEEGADVTLVNRSLERGHLAAQLLGLPFIPLTSFTARGFSLLINATPVGRDDAQMPFELEGLNKDAIIIDLVYGSAPTPLVASALAGGLAAIDGHEVLLIQVLHQFRKMTGREMPPDIARTALGLISDPAPRALTV